jgi:hypothetical protein
MKKFLEPCLEPNSVRYPTISVRLAGEDGNAFAIMGRITQALRRGEVSPEEISKYRKESMAGDYDNLLRVAMNWVREDE